MQAVLDFWKQYGVVGALAAWVVFSALANLLFKLKTPQGWVAWADKIPALHAALTLLRGLGVDPTSIVQAFETYVEKKEEQQNLKEKGQ